MANMSYCRFRNTLEDLRDCADNLHEEVTAEEFVARCQLVHLCHQIAAEARDPMELPINEEDIEDLPARYRAILCPSEKP